MGYHQPIQTWLGDEGAELSRGQCRKLFSCELDLGPVHTEETLFTVGPDETGEMMVLWRETEWSDEACAAVAGAARTAFPEPEIWSRLLEAYLRALKKAESYEGHEFTAIGAPSRGPLPKAEILKIVAKVFGGEAR